MVVQNSRSRSLPERLILGAAVISAALLAASCAAPDRSVSARETEPDVGPGALVLKVEPGKKWTHRMMVFAKLSPSFAGWVETTDGEYVATLLVSGKAGSGSWYGSPPGGRPESLPVWYHAAGVSPENPVLPDSAAPDAVSAASSAEGASAAIAPRLAAGREYVVRFEINQSYDYNETWIKGGKPETAGWSGVNGQPSLVYEACFVYGNSETLALKAVGRGSVDGSNGGVYPSLEGMTTALDIAKSITLEVR